MPERSDHFILICSTCDGPIGAVSAQQWLDDHLPPGCATRLVPCMAGCDRAMTVGIQAPGKAQYLFGDVTEHSDLSALAEFARQYRDSRTGWTNASERPPALLTKTVSRMPPVQLGDPS